MIEAVAEVGCAYLTMCRLAKRCGRNKEVVAAAVPAGEEGKLAGLVLAWSMGNEEPCYREGNYLDGGRVDIQRFRTFTTRG